MLTNNSQFLLYGGSRISPRALLLFVSCFLYVILEKSASAQAQNL